MAPQQELSRSAYERLKAELHDLSTRGRVEVARVIERARELGDVSDSGDYDAAKDDQGRLEARIRHLESLLESAVVVDDVPSGGKVAVGSVVAIRYDGDDDVGRYLIGSIEERHDDLEVISPTSPLGSALMGSEPGDHVEFEAPTGELRVEVVAVGD